MISNHLDVFACGLSELSLRALVDYSTFEIVLPFDTSSISDCCNH